MRRTALRTALQVHDRITLGLPVHVVVPDGVLLVRASLTYVPSVGAAVDGPGIGAYSNVNPATGRGARLCALTLSSGRLAFHSMAPELANEWADAEPVDINGQPTHVRIYLRGDEQVEQTVSMIKAVLEEQ